MNVLSLFDGLSCGQIALNRLNIGYKNYYASEIDKYAIKVTQHNYPNTVQLGDVTKIKADQLPKIDLLIGGPPCQGLSFAGKQLNFDDPRSALFFEYVRLLKELKPKYFLLENVRMKKESQDVISKELGVAPVAINSNLVSAQSRYRLYWTNIPNITQPEDRGIFLKDILEEGVEFKPLSVKELSYMNRKVAGGRTHWDFKHHSDDRDDKSKSIVANFAKGVPYNVLIQVASLYKNNGDAGRIYSTEGKGRTLKGEAGGGGAKMGLISEDHGITYRKLTPVECERLQTVPDNYTKHVSNTQRYKMLGNGWTVDVIAHILKNMELF